MNKCNINRMAIFY